MRDITLADTFFQLFTTRAFATGIPTVLAGTPVVSAYENDSLVQITAGITLGVDHDGVVGLNLLTVVATGANGYEAGKDYGLVITTGTVGGVSVVGEVVAEFSIGRSAAAVDLANGTDGLGVIKADSAAILVDTGTTLDGRIPAALVGGRMDSSTGAMAAAVVTAAAVATGAIDADALAADAVAEIADGVWDEDATAHQTTGTFGQAIGDPVADTNTIYGAVVTGAAGDTVAADIIAVKADTAATLVDTNELQTDWTNGGRLDLILDIIAADTTTDIPALIDALPTAAENADAIWDEDATGHQTGGTFGQAIGDPVADANTIFGAVVTGAAGTTIAADIIAVKADTAAILIDTAEIGAAGAGLTALASQASVNTIDDFLDTEIAAILVDTGTTLDAALAVVDANVDAILADTGTDGVVVAAASKTGYALSAAGVTAVWAEVIEGAVTAVQMMRGFAAALLAKCSGLATSTAVYRDVGDTKDRITATVDADGNRSAVTRDLT